MESRRRPRLVGGVGKHPRAPTDPRCARRATPTQTVSRDRAVGTHGLVGNPPTPHRRADEQAGGRRSELANVAAILRCELPRRLGDVHSHRPLASASTQAGRVHGCAPRTRADRSREGARARGDSDADLPSLRSLHLVGRRRCSPIFRLQSLGTPLASDCRGLLGVGVLRVWLFVVIFAEESPKGQRRVRYGVLCVAALASLAYGEWYYLTRV